MKRWEIKIGKRNTDGSTFWKTIGSIFTSDESNIIGQNGKPATFSIDWPMGSGIIVLPKSKEDSGNNSSNSGETDAGSQNQKKGKKT